MNNPSHGKDGGVWQWLLEQGEERLTQLAEDLSKNRSLTGALGKGLKQAAHTKGQIDRNMQTVLGLLNLPSKADYQRLLTKIETLQGSLINVNMKLDRVLAANEKANQRPLHVPHPPGGGGRSKAKAKKASGGGAA